MGSETRTTRLHHTNCAIHGTLVNGKLRDCTCTAAATPPTPDRAAVRAHVDLEALAKLLELHDGKHTHIGITQPVAHAAARSIRALLRPAPLLADAERDAREAAWFRWLRDNPQAAAFTAVNVAKWVPAGPDLGATMASGTVVGEMEDAKNPDYRYHIAASSLPVDVQAAVDFAESLVPFENELAVAGGVLYRDNTVERTEYRQSLCKRASWTITRLRRSLLAAVSRPVGA